MRMINDNSIIFFLILQDQIIRKLSIVIHKIKIFPFPKTARTVKQRSQCVIQSIKRNLCVCLSYNRITEKFRQ